MRSNILPDYLAEIARIRATRAGTGEVSYYGALAGALNAADERLKPRVFCVPNLRNRGAGYPDMSLFVVARGNPPEDWPEAAAPERGVVEVDDIPAELGAAQLHAQVALPCRLRSLSDAMANGVKFGRKLMLTPHRRREVQARLLAGETQRSIARGYNVGRATISRLPMSEARLG